MKSEAWSKGLVHPLQCIARRISGNHQERSHHRDTSTAAASNQKGYGKARQITPGGRDTSPDETQGGEKKCISETWWHGHILRCNRTGNIYCGGPAPLQPIRGCLKVNSDTMLPGQQMLMDEDKRLRVRAQLLLPEETVHIRPGLEEPVWETDMGSLDQSDLFWSHFFLNLNRKIVMQKSGLLQAEFILWLLQRRIKVIVNVHTNHILEVAFRPTSLQRWVCNTQLFSLILNSAQLWKNLYFDLVNVSAHVLGRASKVCEQISKLPPGSSIVGNLIVCSISRVKRTYSTEKKKCKPSSNSAWARGYVLCWEDESIKLYRCNDGIKHTVHQCKGCMH